MHSSLTRSTSSELRPIADSLASNYTQAGVTFDVGGVERPFPLDLVPRVIAAEEWSTIERGVAQRVRRPVPAVDHARAGRRVGQPAPGDQQQRARRPAVRGGRLALGQLRAKLE